MIYHITNNTASERFEKYNKQFRRKLKKLDTYENHILPRIEGDPVLYYKFLFFFVSNAAVFHILEGDDIIDMMSTEARIVENMLLLSLTRCFNESFFHIICLCIYAGTESSPSLSPLGKRRLVTYL